MPCRFVISLQLNLPPRPALIAALGLFLAQPMPAFAEGGPAVMARVPVLFAAEAASRQISVVVDPGLKNTRALPTEELQLARREMMAGATPTDRLLRGLAEHRDGLAAQFYVRRLLETGSPDEAGLTADIARFGTIAVASGRVWTLPETVAALLRLDVAAVSAEQVAEYSAVIYAHAWAGNGLALEALIQLNGEGRLFGPMSDRTRARIVEQARKEGDGRIFLLMAMTLLRDAGPDTALATDYLTEAQAGTHLGVRTTATAILTRLSGGIASGFGTSTVAEADLIAAEVTRALTMAPKLPAIKEAGQ